MYKLLKKASVSVLIAAAIMVVVPEPHGVSDMCGPSNLPGLSYLNPYVKGCQVWVPFTGNLPQVPVPVNPGTALAPIPGFGGGGGWLGPQPPTGWAPLG